MIEIDNTGDVVNFRMCRGDDLIWSIDFGGLDLTGAVIEASATSDGPLFTLVLATHTAVASIAAAESLLAPKFWAYALVLVDASAHRRTLRRGSIQVIG